MTSKEVEFPVGASLLAKVSAQPTSMSNDTPQSRARAHPQR
jgi:zinc transport system ATP-binding protein